MKARQEGKEYVPPRKVAAAAKQQQQQQQAAEGGKAGGKAGGKGKDEKHMGRNYLGDKQPGWRPFSSVEVG